MNNRIRPCGKPRLLRLLSHAGWTWMLNAYALLAAIFPREAFGRDISYDKLFNVKS